MLRSRKEKKKRKGARELLWFSRPNFPAVAADRTCFRPKERKKESSKRNKKKSPKLENAQEKLLLLNFKRKRKSKKRKQKSPDSDSRGNGVEPLAQSPDRVVVALASSSSVSPSSSFVPRAFFFKHDDAVYLVDRGPQAALRDHFGRHGLLEGVFEKEEFLSLSVFVSLTSTSTSTKKKERKDAPLPAPRTFAPSLLLLLLLLRFRLCRAPRAPRAPRGSGRCRPWRRQTGCAPSGRAPGPSRRPRRRPCGAAS